MTLPMLRRFRTNDVGGVKLPTFNAVMRNDDFSQTFLKNIEHETAVVQLEGFRGWTLYPPLTFYFFNFFYFDFCHTGCPPLLFFVNTFSFSTRIRESIGLTTMFFFVCLWTVLRWFPYFHFFGTYVNRLELSYCCYIREVEL